LPVHLHLAIMETEAWFLEEVTHFSHIDKKITNANLVANGFDPAIMRAHALQQPAVILDNIYKSAGKRYKKTKKQIQRTVKVLSYEELYVNIRPKAPSLDSFVSSLEAGLF
jgi:phosphohistidine phosphatase SixA